MSDTQTTHPTTRRVPGDPLNYFRSRALGGILLPRVYRAGNYCLEQQHPGSTHRCGRLRGHHGRHHYAEDNFGVLQAVWGEDTEAPRRKPASA